MQNFKTNVPDFGHATEPPGILKLVEALVSGQSGTDNNHKSHSNDPNVEGAEAKICRDNFLLTLPLGLVGPRCVSTVSVGNMGCQSIFYTGS